MQLVVNPATGRLVPKGGDSGASIPAVYYVASSVSVSGVRDGSFNKPFENLDFMATEPTTQAEYNEVKLVIILDTETYTLPSTVAMGQWTVDIGAGFLEDAPGGTDWEIDSNLRFGSSTNPTFYVQRNNNIISTAWTGSGFRAILKSGGAAVSLLRLGISGLLRSGDVTISDGTNAGTSCSSLPIFTMYRASFDATGTFRGRLALTSLVQATLSSTGDLEVGYFTGIQNTTISSLNVLESRASTTIKTIRDLILNTSGGVTWTTSTRNWNVDAPSANEVLSKITSYPSATINLTLVGAEAIGYDNSISGLTATDVKAAIDEVADNLGDYLPLAGGTMTGDIDMNGFDLDNIKQAINDGASAANPAFVTGDSGWYGTTAKTMYLSISGSTVARLNVNGYDIIDNNAMFGDVEQNVSGMAVYFDQLNSKTYLGDWRGTQSETYLEIDTSAEYHRVYVNGVQVMDVQANSFEVLVNPHTPDTTVNASTYSITGTDNLIRVTYTATGACTLTLPTLTSALDGVYIQIKDAGYNAETNNITINRSGSDTIEGSATSYVMDSDGQKITLYGDFTNNNWEVV